MSQRRPTGGRRRSCLRRADPGGPMACAPDERLWRVGLDGSHRSLTSPPAQHADESPVFSRDGKTILFIRSRNGDGKLYALRGDKVVGPLLSLGHQDGYYGHQHWWSYATWSLAAKYG